MLGVIVWSWGVVFVFGLLVKVLLFFVIKVFLEFFCFFNFWCFLFSVFVGDVVKNVGINGVIFKGEYGLLGVVEFVEEIELGLDGIEG